MSRKGDCWDNAPTESFWGRLKGCFRNNTSEPTGMGYRRKKDDISAVVPFPATMLQILQSTDNLLVITDAQLKITWVNDGFIRISRYSLVESLGKKPGELLGSGKSAPEAIEKLLASSKTGESSEVRHETL